MANDKKIPEDIINLVIARLETIPGNVKISVGLGTVGGSYSIADLIDRVRSQDEIGRNMIDIQMAYLRNLGNLPTREIKDVTPTH